MMDFDSSKENIQPLRSGRNPLQLSIALNAQDTEEAHRELLQQKEAYESVIRNYDGDDPLKNWYEYISWVEQSFPKRGYEGSFLTLLEDCLSKFEHDKRYFNDRRLCKLFIKYIDLQQNPLELYSILYGRGLCRGIADLYRAWAYYHEAAGDYKSADNVFQLGKKELAQPADELDLAHKNLVFAAGIQVITGTNESRLVEERIALTSLHTYKPGVVGSVRIPNDPVPTLPCSHAILPKPNAAINVYCDGSEELGAAALLPSVLNVARRQDPKENFIHPGTWTQHHTKKASSFHSSNPFKVHEDGDEEEQSDAKGLRLPAKFYPLCNENYTNWHVDVFVQEPHDETKLRMYPKTLVYSNPTTEYSIEELKALNYLKKYKSEAGVDSAAPILSLPPPPLQLSVANDLTSSGNDGIKADSAAMQSIHESPHQNDGSFMQNNHNIQHNLSYQANDYNHVEKGHSYQNVSTDYNHMQRPYENQPPFAFYTDDLVQNEQQMIDNNPYLVNNYSYQENQPPQLNQNENFIDNASYYHHHHHHQPKYDYSQNTSSVAAAVSSTPHHNSHHHMQNASLNHDANYDANFKFDFNNSLFNINDSKSYVSYGICEQASGHVQVPRGTALRTPLKGISTDDLAETGSRGGLEMAAAAQPCDEAKRHIAIHEDDVDAYAPQANYPLDDSLNTQVFNFHLNAGSMSTPNGKVPFRDCVDVKPAKELSVIAEESGGYDSLGSIGGAVRKSDKSRSSSGNFRSAAHESNYNYNLAQNRKANEQLRTSLLEFMDCDSHPGSPVVETLPELPLKVAPLERVPSDPFKPALIRLLLERVAFPGRHRAGYNLIHALPKLNVKKETVFVGHDRYFVEKMLGKGTYGSVFKAVNETTKQVVALKSQKPPNKWEFYMCRELQARLAKHPLRDRFMDVQFGYFCDLGSIIVSKYGPNGSLLDLTNTIKQKYGRTMKESLCVYFCIEMLKIIEAMHEVKIIHADIKPDNFLVFLQDHHVVLQLIDFGCSIDMSMLPDDAAFVRQVKTENFTCCEMLDGRPWNYHTDLFCIGATAHVLLFDKYITMQKVDDNQWSLTQKFTRYWNVPLWTEFFNALLNQQNGLADCKYLRRLLEDNLRNMHDFNSDLRALRNILKNR